MKKKIILSLLALCLVVGSGATYYVINIYLPHQKAVENFETVKKTIDSKNKAFEKMINKAKKALDSGEEPLDESAKTNLESAIDRATKSIKSVPKMSKKTSDIVKQAEKLSDPIDYSDQEDAVQGAVQAFTNSVAQLKQITNPSSNFIEERLKEIPTITGIQSVTETNDPNGNLNKQGGYTASVYFTDSQVTEAVEGVDIVDKGTDAGGDIEVYPTKEDAEKRNAYLSAFDGQGFLNPGSHYVYGTVVIRTSQHLTASQQKELTESIYNKLIELK